MKITMKTLKESLLDPEDMDKYKTPAGDYRTGTDCGNLLKITPEIAEMILNQK